MTQQFARPDAERWIALLKSAYGLDPATELPRAGRALYIALPYSLGGACWRVTKVGRSYVIETQ